MVSEQHVQRSGSLEADIARGIVLELLAVHPEYRRLGAGAALVNAGLSVAEEKGVDAVIESTDAGRPLYEKCGLTCKIEKMEFDVGESFSGEKTPKLCFMVKGAAAAS
jgi:GNAT superfamily N-acetyltransferase